MVLLATLPENLMWPVEDETVLVPTLRVKIHTGTVCENIRALLAWGTRYNMISEKCWKKYNFPLTEAAFTSIRTVTGIVIEVLGESEIKISPNFDEEQTLMLKVLVAKINKVVTPGRVHPMLKAKLTNLNLADPLFDESGEIDLVFGAPIASNMMEGGSLCIYGPVCRATETNLGWVLSGRAPLENIRESQPLGDFSFLGSQGS